MNRQFTFGETLQGGQSLSSIPLLNTDVKIILRRTYVLVAPERIALVSKRIWGSADVSEVEDYA